MAATTLFRRTRSPSAAAMASGNLDTPPSMFRIAGMSSPRSFVPPRPKAVASPLDSGLPKFASNSVRVRSCMMPRLEVVRRSR